MKLAVAPGLTPSFPGVPASRQPAVAAGARAAR